ncbi:unnamed protein product [Diplocarpon coronariae]
MIIIIKEHVPSTDPELKDPYGGTTYDPYKDGVYDKNNDLSGRSGSPKNSTDSQNNYRDAKNNSRDTRNPTNQTPTEFVLEKSALEMPSILPEDE